jgi:hypothetical protein
MVKPTRNRMNAWNTGSDTLRSTDEREAVVLAMPISF